MWIRGEPRLADRTRAQTEGRGSAATAHHQYAGRSPAPRRAVAAPIDSSSTIQPRKHRNHRAEVPASATGPAPMRRSPGQFSHTGSNHCRQHRHGDDRPGPATATLWPRNGGTAGTVRYTAHATGVAQAVTRRRRAARPLPPPIRWQRAYESALPNTSAPQQTSAASPAIRRSCTTASDARIAQAIKRGEGLAITGLPRKSAEQDHERRIDDQALEAAADVLCSGNPDSCKVVANSPAPVSLRGRHGEPKVARRSACQPMTSHRQQRRPCAAPARSPGRHHEGRPALQEPPERNPTAPKRWSAISRNVTADATAPPLCWRASLHDSISRLQASRRHARCRTASRRCRCVATLRPRCAGSRWMQGATPGTNCNRFRSPDIHATPCTTPPTAPGQSR